MEFNEILRDVWVWLDEKSAELDEMSSPADEVETLQQQIEELEVMGEKRERKREREREREWLLFIIHDCICLSHLS